MNGAAYEVPQDRIGARRAQYTASGPPHQRVAILRLASNVFCAETDIGELVRQTTSAQISELRAQLPHPETAPPAVHPGHPTAAELASIN